MSYTNGLDKPTDYFNTKLYTGTGSSNAITGVGFQPDWVWIKSRSDALSHALFDVIRGTTKVLNSNATTAEYTNTDTLTAFGTDGFTVGSNTGVNASGETRVAWNWKANGSGSSNTDGSITSTVSANTTSGFSIVSYTGNGSDGATVGHGLGVNPSAILFKRRNGTSNWSLMGQNIGTAFSSYLKLETTDAFNTNSGMLQNSNSSTFTIGTSSRVNTSTATMIAYCFAEKKGFSKFGSYTGNGSASSGTFTYLGFKPSLIILKRTDSTADWKMYDNKRNSGSITNGNPNGRTLKPNSSAAEGNAELLDFLSNGFKHYNDNGTDNESGATYIYMAFAESPLVTSTGIPATAR